MITPQSTGESTLICTKALHCKTALNFKPLTLDDIPALRPFFELSSCRTCDFTVGGTFMWIDYFDYSYCIYNDTLFIKGVTEDDVSRPAFSTPIGNMGLEESVALLKKYCHREKHDLIFSAVPDAYIPQFRNLGARNIKALDDWSDYLYDAHALATLRGKKLGKKRNHINRFISDNPEYDFRELTPEMRPYVKDFFLSIHLPISKPAIADIERSQVMKVLESPETYGFEGAVLSTPTDGIVAFTLGEIIGDTLYIHIEKMNHEISGAGETINKMFASMMLDRHPELLYINREEDVGDPRLRLAKKSYDPVALLTKYNVGF